MSEPPQRTPNSDPAGRHRPPDSLQPTRILAAPATVVGPAEPPPTTSADFPHVPGYELLGELGRGGMGVVYQARQTGLNRLVALKMLHTGRAADAGAVERFRVEAEAVARFHHPHIVQIYEIGEAGGQPYLALEYVPGPTLAQVLAAGPLPPARAAAVIETAAAAVHYAHQRGVLHRDIKPANILLSGVRSQESGVSKDHNGTSPLAPDPCLLTPDSCPLTPKLTDFGLAKQLEEVTWPTYHGVVGTPGYMAPEQAEGRRDLTPATDVYALGAVLYECLTGRPPFRGANPLSTLRQVAEDDPDPPRSVRPDVPAPLEAVCLKCLHKDPAERYASAAELAADLRRFLAHEPVLARPAGPGERLAAWVRRPQRVRDAGALLTGVGAVFLIWCLAGVGLIIQGSIPTTDPLKAVEYVLLNVALFYVPMVLCGLSILTRRRGTTLGFALSLAFLAWLAGLMAGVYRPDTGGLLERDPASLHIANLLIAVLAAVLAAGCAVGWLARRSSPTRRG